VTLRIIQPVFVGILLFQRFGRQLRQFAQVSLLPGVLVQFVKRVEMALLACGKASHNLIANWVAI